MSEPPFKQARSLQWVALLIATIAISALFVDMTATFFMAMFLAAISAELIRPLNRRIVAALGRRSAAGTAITLILLAGAVVWPLAGLLYLAGTQAASLAGSVEHLTDQAKGFDPTAIELPDWVPFREQLAGGMQNVAAKIGQFAQSVAGYFVDAISDMAVGAAKFFIDLFIFFYALFFFVQMRPPVLQQILRYSGLPVSIQDRLFERAVSITRATLKGTLIIGMVQGGLGGLAFWVAGIDGAAFWAVVMAILSVIPGLGAPFVLFCGAAYLAFQDQIAYAVAMVVWGVAVVGTIDNVLRPILVGRDVGLHDLFILISTLGGLATFGPSGLIVGPVLAGLFVCIWEEIAEATGNTEAGAGAPIEDPPPDMEPSVLLDDDLARDLADLKRSKAEREVRRRGEPE